MNKVDLLDELMNELHRVHNVDFSAYRRAYLERRMRHRAAAIGCHDLEDYLEVLRADPEEAKRLIHTVLITVSSFFRNPIVFEILGQSLLPEILRRKRDTGDRELRVWSAGCATGEEPYSAAMRIHDACREEVGDWTIHVFATDIDTSALREARTGVFPKERLANVTLATLEAYFEPVGDRFRVTPDIRHSVMFSEHDLLAPDSLAPAESVFGSFDLLLCRNVLIYFAEPHRKAVLELLYRSLEHDGYLILGESEVPNDELRSRLKTFDARNRIYQKREQ